MRVIGRVDRQLVTALRDGQCDEQRHEDQKHPQRFDYGIGHPGRADHPRSERMTSSSASACCGVPPKRISPRSTMYSRSAIAAALTRLDSAINSEMPIAFIVNTASRNRFTTAGAKPSKASSRIKR